MSVRTARAICRYSGSPASGSSARTGRHFVAGTSVFFKPALLYDPDRREINASIVGEEAMGSYSSRSALEGLTRAARRAGSQAAVSATSKSVANAKAVLSGSMGCSSNSEASRSREMP